MSGPTLEGKKTLLRPWKELLNDANLRRIYRWSRDREVMYWMGFLPTPLSFPEFAQNVRQHASRTEGKLLTFGILDKSGRLIGRITCYNIDAAFKEGEIGIVIGEKGLWGKGYGSDALQTFLNYLFLEKGFRRIHLRTIKGNIRAQRCFARCGFQNTARKVMLSLETGEFEGVEMELWVDEFLRRNIKPPEVKDE